MQQVDQSLLTSRMPAAVSSGNKYRDFVLARIAMLEGVTPHASNISDKDKEAILAKALPKFRELLRKTDYDLEAILKAVYDNINSRLNEGKDNNGKNIPDAHKDFLKMVYYVEGFNTISRSNGTSEENTMTASTLFKTTSTTGKTKRKNRGNNNATTTSSSLSTADSAPDSQHIGGWEKQLDEESKAVLGDTNNTSNTTTAATNSSNSANLDTDDLPGNPDDKKKAATTSTNGAFDRGTYNNEVETLRTFIDQRLNFLRRLKASKHGIDFNRMQSTYEPAIKFFNGFLTPQDCLLKQDLAAKYNDILGRNFTNDNDGISHYQQAYNVTGFALVAGNVDITLVGDISKFQNAVAPFVEIDLNNEQDVAQFTGADFGYDTDDDDDNDLSSASHEENDDVSVTPPAQNKNRFLKYVGVGLATVAIAATALYLCRNTEMGSKLITMVKELFNRSANTPKL